MFRILIDLRVVVTSCFVILRANFRSNSFKTFAHLAFVVQNWVLKEYVANLNFEFNSMCRFNSGQGLAQFWIACHLMGYVG